FRLTLPPRDLALRRRLTQRPLDSAEAAAVEQLYSGKAGLVVRQEIAVWNAAHLVAAIRDARPVRGGRATAGILPIGEKPNRWDVEALVQIGGAETRQAVQVRDALSLDLFGYFGWGDRAWPAPDGDWRSAAPSAASLLAAETGDEAPVVRFSDQLDGETVVDLVGADPVVEGAEVLAIRQLCQGFAAEKERPNAATGQLETVLIRERREIPECGEAALQTRAYGEPASHRLRVRPLVPGGAVRVLARPVPHIPDRMAEFTTAPLTNIIPTDWDGWRTYRGGESIALRCRQTGGGPECALDWILRDRERQEAPQPIEIRTADAEALTVEDGGGDPGGQAQDLGLAALVGLGASDRFGAAGTLARQPRAVSRTLSLTLRSDLQEIVRDAVLREVYEEPERRFLAEQHDAVRRAAVVLVDASDDPARRGAILAAADFPSARVESGSAWNLLGYDVWRPLKSPLAPRAWARIDAQTTPGSTLKTLTAMALIRAAAGQELSDETGRLHRAIDGYADPLDAPGIAVPRGVTLAPEGWVELPGRFWAKGVHDCVQGRSGLYNWRASAKICNFVFEGRLEGHDHAHLAPIDTGCPVRRDGTPEAKQLGLCEAVATSLNSWFILAGLGVDGETAFAADRPRLLSLLAERFPAAEGRNLLRLPSAPAARFRAERLVLDGDRPSENPLHTLALNTIGQNAQASPLAIASLYASVASGCRVDPRLTTEAIRAEDCAPLFFVPDDSAPAQAYSLELSKEAHAQELMRAYLVPGLRAVVNTRIGTADGAFNSAEYRGSVYGKTGTAEVPLDEDTLVNSVWFAGWAEADVFEPMDDALRLPGRVAFACMVSHGRLRRASGGRVCAPLIRKILDQIRKGPLPEGLYVDGDAPAASRPEAAQ
ncbi:MAG: penicillin-binding transpeptidase domain-containing protein, partial [Pseudomonadota bacterium]